ncbi:MAG: hypothetical protein KAQ97_00955, partial [Candidatus Fermentibacteraceae bacterium]|nr:hypothetical protein [Candidatus Fermentibacteraceae bacterium]
DKRQADAVHALAAFHLLIDDLVEDGPAQKLGQRIGSGFMTKLVCFVAHMGDQDADVLVKGANRSSMILFVDLASNTAVEFLGKYALYHSATKRSRDEPAAVIILLPDWAVFLVAGKGFPAPLHFGLRKQAAPILIA